VSASVTRSFGAKDTGSASTDEGAPSFDNRWLTYEAAGEREARAVGRPGIIEHTIHLIRQPLPMAPRSISGRALACSYCFRPLPEDDLRDVQRSVSTEVFATTSAPRRSSGSCDAGSRRALTSLETSAATHATGLPWLSPRLVRTGRALLQPSPRVTASWSSSVSRRLSSTVLGASWLTSSPRRQASR